LGEVFLTLANDAETGDVPLTIANDASGRLVEAVRRDQVRLCGIGSHSGGDTIGLATRLRRGDNRLTPTDALIAATAICCEDCEILYTNDPLLLACAPLLELAAEKPMVVREAP